MLSNSRVEGTVDNTHDVEDVECGQRILSAGKATAHSGRDVVVVGSETW